MSRANHTPVSAATAMVNNKCFCKPKQPELWAQTEHAGLEEHLNNIIIIAALQSGSLK